MPTFCRKRKGWATRPRCLFLESKPEAWNRVRPSAAKAVLACLGYGAPEAAALSKIGDALRGPLGAGP